MGGPHEVSLPRFDTVAKSAPQQRRLKLYTEHPPRPAPPSLEMIGCLPRLLRAFEGATGWPLQSLAPRLPTGLSLPPRDVRDTLEPATEGESKPVGIDRRAAQSLAQCTADLLHELLDTRRLLWQGWDTFLRQVG